MPLAAESHCVSDATDGFISEAEFIDAYPDWALECGYETKADKGIGWTDQDRQICLDVHNRLRKLHGAKPLKWSNKLAKKAQKAANICETVPPWLSLSD